MDDDTLTEHERNLHDLYAGFAMIGLLMKGEKPHLVTTKSFVIADEMLLARNAPHVGIKSIKTKPKEEDHE